MPTSENYTNLRGNAFRHYIRCNAPCTICGAPQGYYCQNPDGSMRQMNHADRVTAVTGQDLATADWQGARIRKAAGNRTRGTRRRTRNTPGGW